MHTDLHTHSHPFSEYAETFMKRDQIIAKRSGHSITAVVSHKVQTVQYT